MKKIIETQRAPGAIGPYVQGVDLGSMVFTQAHDGAFTKLFLNLAQCCRQRFLFVFVDSHFYSCHAG